jgi:(R)-2-hydroxyglutarate---pyruvate transhydrogenase
MISLKAATRSALRTPRQTTHRITSRLPHRWLSSITRDDVNHLRSLLSSPTSLISTLSDSPASQDDLDAYNTDWMGKYKGKATTVVRPRSTDEVSKILKYCSQKKIPVVPQGGNTGLVGGSVPLGDELVINLGSMSSVRSFDPVSGRAFAPTSTRHPFNLHISSRHSRRRCRLRP